MPENSNFVSRQGKLSCTPEELYDFVTDIRNLVQFIPENAGIKDLSIEKDTCSLTVTSLGKVNFSLDRKTPFTQVAYKGTLFQSNDFSLSLDIIENESGKADVVLRSGAQLNPFLKMIVSDPVKNLLERMIDEMEKFRDWRNTNT